MPTIARRILARLPRAWQHALRARHYTRFLRHATVASEPDLALIPTFVRAGDTVIDLGANIGLYTKILADTVGPAGRVVSLEPVPETFDYLRRSVDRLGLGQVRLVNAAVSSQPGEVRMAMGATHYEAHVATDGEAAVAAVTLDSIPEAAAASFIKCDVEGHELACLDGAAQTLAARRAVWLVEVSGHAERVGTSAAAVFQRFSEHGYAPWVLDHGTLRPKRRGEYAINYLFRPVDASPERAER